MSKPEDILEKILSGELTREKAIRQRPDMHDRLLLLTDLADELSQLPRHRPDPDFRNAARLRLLQHVYSTPRRSLLQRLLGGLGPAPAWASRAAAVMVAGGALTAGVSWASASALPDDALYPAKRAVEQMRVTLAVTDQARASAYLGLADQRAAEMAAVAGFIDEASLQGLTSDYGQALQQVGTVVGRLSSPPPALLERIRSHLASQATELEAGAVNSASKPAVQRALAGAEVVASNVADHVELVAEQHGQPGPHDIRLAADAQAAEAAGGPGAENSTAGGTVTLSTLDGQFDHLWNQVAEAPFMATAVRTDLKLGITAAKRNADGGRIAEARSALIAVQDELQRAVRASDATQYTANGLNIQIAGLLTELSDFKPTGT